MTDSIKPGFIRITHLRMASPTTVFNSNHDAAITVACPSEPAAKANSRCVNYTAIKIHWSFRTQLDGEIDSFLNSTRNKAIHPTDGCQNGPMFGNRVFAVDISNLKLACFIDPTKTFSITRTEDSAVPSQASAPSAFNA
jgi:hypothetical protein